MPLGQRHHLIPRAVAIDAGPDHEDGPRAAIEPGADRLDQRRIRIAQPAHRPRVGTGSLERSQSSTGIETNVGPHGCCIAT